MARPLLALCCLWTALVLVAGCGVPNAPAGSATVTPTVATVVPGAPTDAPAPDEAQPTVFVGPASRYRLTLPCCWVALPAPNAAVQSALEDVEDETLRQDLTELAERLRPEAVDEALELIAILPGESGGAVPQAQLTVSVLPRAGLTPEAFLDATRAGFEAIVGSRVLSTTVDMDLRADTPVAIIETSSGPTPGDTLVTRGLQIALPSVDGTAFVVLTFTTSEDVYPALVDEFRQIAATVDLEPDRP